MKITKRILAVLLLAALLVSCMLLTVSAEDPFNAEGISDIEDVLEYYELEDFLADNYEDGTWDTKYYSGTDTEVVADPLDETNKVLKVMGKNSKYSNASVTDKLIVSFDIYLASDMEGEFKLDVKMFDASDIESLTYNTMFSINMRDGVFQNSVWDSSYNNGDGGFSLTTYDAIAPQADTWYNVVIFFDTAEDKYNFKISADGKQSWTCSDNYSLGAAKQLTSFELKTSTKRNDVINLYLDNAEIYCGTFERNPSNKESITAQTIIDLEALYLAEGTTSEDKVRIAEVFVQLIDTYGYEPKDSTPNKDTVEKIIAKVPEYINCAFAEELARRASQIDVNTGYTSRVAFITESEYYSNLIPANEELAEAPGFKENPDLITAVTEARQAFDMEYILLLKVEEDSIAFVEKMAEFDAASKDYDGYLKEFYETVISFANRDANYDKAVEGVELTMADAVAMFEAFDEKYTRLNSAANTFISGADMMTEALEEMSNSNPHEAEYEEAFAKLAQGYHSADSVYNGGDIDEALDENTHTALKSRFPVYLNNKDWIVGQIEICNQFIDIVKKAQTATYYTTIKEHLDEAATIVGNIREKYVGVPEALDAYNSLTDAVVGSSNASEAYINAVDAVVAAQTFEDKQKAIEAALILKTDGDVIGIAGVKEANIALSIEMTELETIIASSASLKTLVVEIEKASTFAARRELLSKAAVAAKKAEASIDGVADALEKYEAFAEEYKTEVAAMNTVHSTATDRASDLAGAASGEAGVYKAADIINKIPD